MNNQGIGVKYVHVHNDAAFILDTWLSWGKAKSPTKRESHNGVVEWNDLGSTGVGIPDTENFRVNVHAVGGITHHVEEDEYFYDTSSDKVLEVNVIGSTLVFELNTSS